MSRFTRIATDPQSAARAGVLVTDHGEIQTPIFMPVGTVGSVKGVYHRDLQADVKAQIILGNTYHLYLRPGLDTLYKAGGLHKFEHWDKPILTDSGGFQVFSLAPIRKLTEEGCTFRSHTEPLYGYSQTMFPIIQGCVYPELRKQAVEHALSLDNDNRGGYAVGGLAVGEPTEKMYEMLEVTCPLLPEDKPRYLMGVGTPANILEGIARGIDMFDCVMPTRNGRNGMLFTWDGIMNMRNAKWTDDFSPLDPLGTSFVDSYYTRAYIHHLFIAKEMFAAMVASEHNLAFYLDLVRVAREHIVAGDFLSWKNAVAVRLMQRL